MSAELAVPAAAEPPARDSAVAARRSSGGTLARWAVLLVCGLYFVGPFVAAISFTVRERDGSFSFDAYREIFARPEAGQVSFTQALAFSVVLSCATILVTLALMLPTQVLLHLRWPRLRGLVEVICLLPLVCPPVVLVVGVSSVYRSAQPEGADTGGTVFELLRWIRDDNHPVLLVALYVVLALPFVYQILDAGLRSVEVKTLVEASRSLGAGWWTTLVGVLLPSLRTSIVNAGFLCFALTMGEYTVSSILLYNQPFPVWLAQLPTSSGQTQAAVSVFGLLLVEVILLVVSGFSLKRSGTTRTRKSPKTQERGRS